MDKNNKVNIKACSYKTMQTYLELSRVSISRAVKTLKQYGIITIDKIGNSNSYTVNPNIVKINFKAKYPSK
jgi:predicted transcriptional regulator